MTGPKLLPPERISVVRAGRRDFVLRATRLGLRRAVLAASNELISLGLSRPFGLIHVVEYPKCGGSWLRNMSQSLRGGSSFSDAKLIRPQAVVLGHWVYRPWLSRPVVMVRDPRDVFVSYYYHETCFVGREANRSINRFFQSDPTQSLQDDFARYLEAKLTNRTDPPFSFGELLVSWRSRPGVSWACYEKFLDDPVVELTRLAAQLHLPTDPASIRAVVDQHSFEAANRARGSARHRGDADPSAFERKGVVGDWRNHFNAKACELIERHEGWTLRELGYESDTGWIKRHLASQGSEIGRAGPRD